LQKYENNNKPNSLFYQSLGTVLRRPNTQTKLLSLRSR